MYSDRLVEIRQIISSKRKEINELEVEKKELWEKIVREINDNTARYKKIEGLSGFKFAKLGYTDNNEQYVIINFDTNSRPTASALANIESDTHLKFKGNFTSSDNYGFGL